jgi:hypothetical protein
MPHTIRRTLPSGAVRAAMFAVLTAFGISAAQPATVPVSDVLPATTVAAFYAAPASAGWGALAEIWDALDLDAASQTLGRLTGEASDMTMAGAMMGASFGSMRDEALDDLAIECPELARVLESDALEGLAGPAVLAISVSPFSPLPGAVAVVRPGDADLAASLQDALIGCFGGDVALQEGDVTLHVVGDATDLPLVLARFDGLFVAATDPELVRATVRLARGSTDPRFVDGPVGREAAALMDEGIGIALDLAALADAFESLRGLLPMDDGADAVIDRLLTTLRTVGGFAARITIDDAGILMDSVLTTDPTAGDPELARLLVCEECRPGAPRLIPAGVLSLQGMVFSPVALVEWLDGWLLAVGRMVGEPLDLRSLATEFAEIDLDAALLDWIGTTWHTAQLEPLGTDVRGWVTGAPSITVVPVSSEAAARAGVERWKRAIEGAPLLFGDAFGGGPFDLMGSPADAASSGFLSVRELEYRGVGYERWRIGPTVDVAIAVLDSHLVLASPARAMRGVIDVHHGAPGVQDDPVLRSALASVSERANGYVVADVVRAALAAAELSDFLGAPAASLLAVVITESQSTEYGDDWDDWDSEWGDWGMDWNVDEDGLSVLSRSPTAFGDDPRADGVPIETIAVPGSITRAITESDVLSNGELGFVLDLTGLRAGDRIQIEMLDRSNSVDTYLYLFDFDAGEVVADNDDAPSTTRSEIIFEVAAGTRYALVASSFGRYNTGTVEINTQVIASAEASNDAPAASEAAPADRDDDATLDAFGDEQGAPPVTFDEVVGLFDVATAFLEEFAARSGVALGVTETEGGVVRSTLRIPLR